MAKRWYIPNGPSTELEVVIDPELFTLAGDNVLLTDNLEIQGLSDDLRLHIGSCLGFNSLADYDTALVNEEDDIRDRLDYYSYGTRVESPTVADGSWFSPIAVESFCAEDVTNVAARSIDEMNNTFWRDSTNHQHTIVYELRAYPKKISKIRFRYGAGESARERLNNMDVHASRGIGNIDNAENILETGINISWPVAAGEVWVEHTLASKKNKARFVKLVVDDTDNGSNQLQIREFEVFVETRDP